MSIIEKNNLKLMVNRLDQTYVIVDDKEYRMNMGGWMLFREIVRKPFDDVTDEDIEVFILEMKRRGKF